MVAFFGFLFFLVGVALTVLTIVGMVRIVTNCGYSGWWVLAYFSPPIVGYLLGITLVATVSATGSSESHFLGVAFGYFVIMILSFLVSQLIFLRFAFADWPLLQQARARQASGAGPWRHGFGGGFGKQTDPNPGAPPAWGPFPGQAPASSMPPPVVQEGTEPGWYRSGPIGAGEQSYWDGTAWTARRRWQNSMWVDLPAPPPPDELQ